MKCTILHKPVETIRIAVEGPELTSVKFEQILEISNCKTDVMQLGTLHSPFHCVSHKVGWGNSV